MTSHRVGLIVPSSNTTMETEVPAILRGHERVRPETFTFHSARIRMRAGDPGRAHSDGPKSPGAAALADADGLMLMAYACLVATMSQGDSAHLIVRPGGATAGARRPGGSRWSHRRGPAGQALEGLHDLGAKKVAVIAPYMKPLTATGGADTLNTTGALEGRRLHQPRVCPTTSRSARWTRHRTCRPGGGGRPPHGADALVLSACVQMPSLPVLQAVQDQFDIPVVSAAAATAWRILIDLGLDPVAPGAPAPCWPSADDELQED